ncbi:MAG: sulfatase-like hydrolase/transferase [Pirellulaceae bacterium]
MYRRLPLSANIIFFFVDDMGWQDTSVPFHTEVTELNRIYRTPNMERLAAKGMLFRQAYACSVCSPSRVSLMTGANSARHGVTNWTLRAGRQADTDHPLVVAADWNLNGLSPDPQTPRAYHAVTLPATSPKWLPDHSLRQGTLERKAHPAKILSI